VTTQATYDVNDFAADVLERSFSIPVLVDFWAEWCGPCKVLGPVLEKLAGQHEGEWALAKLDTEAHPQISAQYAIRSIPNVKLFVDGKVTDEFVGALPESKVVEWLSKAIPSKYRAQLEGARELLSQDRASQAQEILLPIVAAEPDNHEALVLLARAMFSSDYERAAKTVEPVKLGSEQFEAAEAIRTLANAFTQIADPQSLPEDPVKEPYLIAIGAARSNDFEAALEGFLGVIRKNRYYDDDGSRKACISIFNLLGNDDQITKKYRPTLGSALY
jgi:putative thioredoxin